MHKIAISPAALERMMRRMGKLHPFDSMTPGKTALLVIDMQNYFVKPGHQGEIPTALEIVPNINRLAAGLRGRGGHVVWIRNGTRDTRQSWSTLHENLMTPERVERRLAEMDVDGDGYAYGISTTFAPKMRRSPRLATALSSRAPRRSSNICATAASRHC